MAADKITYADKVSIDPKLNPVNQLWRYVDANEVKEVVNAHADQIDENVDNIDFINRNIITNTKTIGASDYTLEDSDAGKLIFAQSSDPIRTITIDSLANGAIPVGSSVYIQKSTTNRIILEAGSGVTIFAQNNGNSNEYEIELFRGVVCVNHFFSNQYIISGNLLIG